MQVDTFAILATGASMSKDVADSVKGRCKVIAVSNAYTLAPWADALFSADSIWWLQNKNALKFAGEKYSFGVVDGVKKIEPAASISSGSNSGLVACHVAHLLGAKKIILLGMDMRGTHYFGPHPMPLKNTTEARFIDFHGQFFRWKPQGVEIINCTEGSTLKHFPFSTIDEALC